MIFVILGTQDKQFERLLKEVEHLILDGAITKKVVVQAGTTSYASDVMEIHSMLPINQFLDYIQKSDYIITHGGAGTILDAMKQNKKIIAVPRLKIYGEHENDHQTQIIQKLSEQEYIIGCKGVEKLKDAIQQIDQFKPKSCTLGNTEMVETITHYIENTSSTKRKQVMLYAFYAICAMIVQIILYYFLHFKGKEIDAMWISWLLSYVVMILLVYPKRKHTFEVIWGVLLAIVQILWLNLCDSWQKMLLVTLLADVVTYIGHNLFYGGKVK